MSLKITSQDAVLEIEAIIQSEQCVYVNVNIKYIPNITAITISVKNELNNEEVLENNSEEKT